MNIQDIKNMEQEVMQLQKVTLNEDIPAVADKDEAMISLLHKRSRKNINEIEAELNGQLHHSL